MEHHGTDYLHRLEGWGLPQNLRVWSPAMSPGCAWDELVVQDLPHVPASRLTVPFYELYKLDTGQTVIDVGLNDGGGVKEALESRHTVLGFEPVPALCNLLRTKFGRHPRFHLQCAVASNRNGTVTLHESLAGSASSTLSKGVVDGLSIRSREVAVASALVDNHAGLVHRHVLVFKSDTQGHELQVLQGAEQVVRRFGVSYFYVEFDPYLLRQSGTEAPDVLRWFDSRGFRCRYARPRKCKQYAGDGLKRKCWTDVLCAPRGAFVGVPRHCIRYDEAHFIGSLAGTQPWPT